VSDKERKAPAVPPVSVTHNADVQEVMNLKPDTLDPNLHYRFARNDQSRITRLMTQGFRMVKRSDGVEMVVDLEGGASEDLIKIGDTVLMACPIELHEQRQERKGALRRSRMEAPEGQFRKKARDRNIKVNDE
jgi:hypothetical protein